MEHPWRAHGKYRALAAILVVLLSLSGCGDDNPVKPVAQKDYVVWCNDFSGTTHRYYGYHLATGQVDSFYLSLQAAYGMTVSPDGRRLYVPTTDGTSIIDIEQEAVVQTIPDAEYPCGRGHVFSPDGRFVAFQGEELNLLSYPDHTLVFHDTAEVWMGYFTPDSKMFYGVGYSSNQVRIVNMETLEVTAWDNPFMYPLRQMVPTANPDKWLLYFTVPLGRGLFAVLDRQADSLVFMEYLGPGRGQIVLAWDSQIAFYNNPGSIVDDIPPSSDFRVFDVDRNRIRCLLSTVGIINGIDPGSAPVGYLAVSSDGKWLVAVDKWGEYLFVFDIATLELVHYYQPAGISMGAFTGPVVF